MKREFVAAGAALQVLACTMTAVLTAGPVLAQGSPLPGGAAAPAGGGYGGSPFSGSNYGTNTYSNQYGATTTPAATPLQAGGVSAPVPGVGLAQPAAAPSGKAPGSKYKELPITVDSAKYRLDELRSMLAATRPQEMQDSVQELCEWLTDAADAHYRMYLAFAKSDLTRAQANSEKDLNQHFSQLKREAQLLRADLLIKQMRAPEALGPLVDIVVADPRSNTGKEAYKRLVDLGFSQAAPQAAAKAAATEGEPGMAGSAASASAGTSTHTATSATAQVRLPATAPVVPPKDIKTQANSQATRPLH